MTGTREPHNDQPSQPTTGPSPQSAHSPVNGRPAARAEPWQSAQPAAVYRLYDADGQLLYIGSAFQPAVRQGHHARKPWGPEIARREDRWYRDRETAYAEETVAIRSELPRYNVTDNPERPIRHTGNELDASEECEEVRLILSALAAVERIADPEARSRAQARVAARTRERAAEWNAERGVLARQLKAAGESVRSIARRLGVEPATAQDLLRGFKGSGRDRPLSELRRARRRGSTGTQERLP
ncbi:hypothetical protein [Streptomyces cylindrosporus]|uniref:GIY-YIG domain-containing protein n=1 Tax=Streptomyces cylindrosporus TaxID=2927583 RepID=A0ABS9YK83_9ACTN|nr:hypothetical protein [Streptomyces cylindrosporus]MCI3277609.1 hypothetical protein [Streptomyces cylindrosporus]